MPLRGLKDEMEPGDITQLLRAYDAGDQGAFDRMVPLVYDELRRLAHRHIRRGPWRGKLLRAGGDDQQAVFFQPEDYALYKRALLETAEAVQ